MKLFIVTMLHVICSIGIDRDQNNAVHVPFKTVTIGDKIWMAENYKANISAGSCYEDNLTNCMNNGRLYSYEAALKSAPPGWHLPTKEEWNNLLNELRKQEKNPYEVLTKGDFNATLAGFKDADGDYTKINYQVRFWSSTSWGNENDKAWYMYLNKSREMADVDTDEKKMFVLCTIYQRLVF